MSVCIDDVAATRYLMHRMTPVITRAAKDACPEKIAVAVGLEDKDVVHSCSDHVGPPGNDETAIGCLFKVRGCIGVPIVVKAKPTRIALFIDPKKKCRPAAAPKTARLSGNKKSVALNRADSVCRIIFGAAVGAGPEKIPVLVDVHKEDIVSSCAETPCLANEEKSSRSRPGK